MLQVSCDYDNLACDNEYIAIECIDIEINLFRHHNGKILI